MDEMKNEVVENVIEATKETVAEVTETGICEVADAAAGKTSILTKIIIGLSAILAIIGIGKGIKKLIGKIKAKKEAKKIEKAEKEGYMVANKDDYVPEGEENEETGNENDPVVEG